MGYLIKETFSLNQFNGLKSFSNGEGYDDIIDNTSTEIPKIPGSQQRGLMLVIGMSHQWRNGKIKADPYPMDYNYINVIEDIPTIVSVDKDTWENRKQDIGKSVIILNYTTEVTESDNPLGDQAVDSSIQNKIGIIMVRGAEGIMVWDFSYDPPNDLGIVYVFENIENVEAKYGQIHVVAFTESPFYSIKLNLQTEQELVHQRIFESFNGKSIPRKTPDLHTIQEKLKDIRGRKSGQIQTDFTPVLIKSNNPPVVLAPETQPVDTSIVVRAMEKIKEVAEKATDGWGSWIAKGFKGLSMLTKRQNTIPRTSNAKKIILGRMIEEEKNIGVPEEISLSDREDAKVLTTQVEPVVSIPDAPIIDLVVPIPNIPIIEPVVPMSQEPLIEVNKSKVNKKRKASVPKTRPKISKIELHDTVMSSHSEEEY